MDPRIAMFQRKGAPMSDEGLDGGPNALDDASPMPEGTEGAVMCPNCQCEFDPATGEVMNASEYPDDGMQGSMEGMTEGPMEEVI